MAPPPTRSRRTAWIRTLPVWQRWLVLLLFLAALNYLPALDAWRLAHADRVTVHVTDCPKVITKHGGCAGTWTLPDGRTGHGAIDGYQSTRSGADLSGWADSSRATTDLTLWMVFPVVGAVVTSLGLILAAVLILFYRARRPRT